MLSVSAMARKRGRPSTLTYLLRSFIMCEAVAAEPPLPAMKTVRRSRQADMSASATAVIFARERLWMTDSSSVR